MQSRRVENFVVFRKSSERILKVYKYAVIVVLYASQWAIIWKKVQFREAVLFAKINVFFLKSQWNVEIFSKNIDFSH